MTWPRRRFLSLRTQTPWKPRRPLPSPHMTPLRSRELPVSLFQPEDCCIYPDSSAKGRPSVSVCPTRIVNPTYTTSSPLPTDYTWGCPPHHLCQPDKQTGQGQCNFEMGPPADTYYCSPDECIPSPPLIETSASREREVGKFDIAPGYFNLNPADFGLDIGIFVFGAQPISERELSFHLPGKCYNLCNDAMLAAEHNGKTPGLCDEDSDFLTAARPCHACANSVNTTRKTTNQIPQFQQFFFYCSDQLDTSTTSGSQSTTPLRHPKATSRSSHCQNHSPSRSSRSPTRTIFPLSRTSPLLYNGARARKREWQWSAFPITLLAIFHI